MAPAALSADATVDDTDGSVGAAARNEASVAPFVASASPTLATVLSIGLAFVPIAVSAGLLVLWRALSGGDVPVVPIVVGMLVVRQFTAFTISVALHRGAAHRQFELHPALELPLRVWNFFFQGSTRVWSVMHRLHHKHEDTALDPHSPIAGGGSLGTIFQKTSASYFRVARALWDGDSLARFDVGLPRDAFERFAVAVSARGPVSVVIARIPFLFVVLALGLGPVVAACVMLGLIGSIWGSTVFAINGLAHVIGYRNQAGGGNATNLVAKDWVMWGEGLHHNHHLMPGRSNLALTPRELDPGYAVLCVLDRLGLVRRLERTP